MEIVLVDRNGRPLAIVEFVIVPMGLSEPRRDDGRGVPVVTRCVNPNCPIHGDRRQQRPDGRD